MYGFNDDDRSRSTFSKQGEKDNLMVNKWQKNIIFFLRGWGFSFFIALIITLSFRSAIADWNDVPSGSMKPTILEGDRIFVNKLAYDLKIPFIGWQIAHWDDPQRGDIVIFFSQFLNQMSSSIYIYGLSGNKITIVG